MTEPKVRFEHFACLASSAGEVDSQHQTHSDYQTHKPLYQTDSGYALYELKHASSELRHLNR